MNQRKLDWELASALNREDVGKAKELIARGGDINAPVKGTRGFTMLWLAANYAALQVDETTQELDAAIAEFLPATKQVDRVAERQKSVRMLKTLLELGADVNKLCNGSTALRVAVSGKDLEVVQLLLAHGANPGSETFSLFSKLARKSKPGYSSTVLHEAVKQGSLPIAQVLLEAGADPNRANDEGQTPLVIAREKGFNDLVALLKDRTTLEYLPALDAVLSDNIWQAAGEGRLADLQRLIGKGVKVHARNPKKATPLHVAAEAGRMAVVKWLVQQGAKLDAKRSDHSTPLYLAASAGHTEVVKLLVLHQAAVDAAERSGTTPLAAAIGNGHLEIAEFLLRHGANPNHQIKGLLNMTALMLAAGQKLLQAVELLLANGADARLRDAWRQNALHHAVSGAVAHQVVEIDLSGQPSEALPEGPPGDALPIIERLLAAGADPEARDHEGQTPLVCARKVGLAKIAAILDQSRKISPRPIPGTVDRVARVRRGR